MRKPNYFILLFFLLSNLIVLGQKTDNISFEGYFKNNPKHYLPEIPFTVKYTVSEWFKDQMKEKEVKLELKGYEEGTGYTLIFMADDPELKAVVMENYNLTTKKNEYKAIVKAESNAKVIILNEKNEKAYEINFVPKLQMAISEGLGVKATKAEAEAQNKEIISKKKDYLKKMYVKEVINAYQDTLDAYFGKYNKQEKFRMALLKPIDFTYDDFNGAVEKFKASVSTPEINMADVESAIDILEKCKLEYQPGKKTRICDVNIDELYLNLVQAYMVKGDYENAKINWEKSSEIKGNRTAEGYVARFYSEQVSNLNSYPVSKANYAPVPTISKDTQKGNKLFFNLFFDFYLTQVLRQTSLIIDYIPIYTPDLKRMEASQTYSDYIQEKLIVNYDYSGVPLSATYAKTEEDEKPRNYQFDFKYDNNKIISVTQNNIPKFNLTYNGDTLKSVNIRMNQTTNYIYNMDYNNPERTEIKLQVEKDGKKSDSHSRYYVKLNTDGSIKGYYLDSYVLREKLYDTSGNWIGVKGTNESTGEDYEVNFTNETDEKGNITKRSYNKSLQVERKLIYN